MNKKGFTLVELLAVIVILALLALLTSTAVTKLVKDAKEDLSETQIQLIKSAADTWIADNLNNLPSSGDCGYLTLEDLKYYGLLDNTILDPKNSEEISNDLKIKITTTASAYGNPVTNAEVNPESIEECSQIYFPICTIAADSTVQGLNMGAKYNCKVDPNKDPYTFYVLTSAGSDSSTVNMIMDSNINISGEAVKETNPLLGQNGLVEWISWKYLEEHVSQENLNNGQNWNIYGPLSAMQYLQTATKDWTNANSQTVNTFTDEKGKKHDMAQTFISNARLPYLSEVQGTGCELYEDGSCPNWMVNYLSDEGYQSNEVNDVYGYWLLSSYDTSRAWFVLNNSCIDYDEGIDYSESFGVRPVITVPVNRIIQ